MRAYFVSDLHLTSPDDPRSRLFESFLGRVLADGETTHLVLLGDIFDLWLGKHAYFIERYRPIVEALHELVRRGVAVHYFEGNHDLHLAPFWERELGATVHVGPVQMEMGGRQVRLEHGDQMDPDDRGYIFLRWFLRTPPIRWLLLHLPGSVIARIGERASAHSRTYTSSMKTISNDKAVAKIRAHAEKVHAEAPFDIVVSGHVHVRDDTVIRTPAGEARSINLGTWLDGPCYLQLDDGGLQLIELDPPAVAQSKASSPAAAPNNT